MPYKNKEDRKKQTNKPVDSEEFKARMERQRARRDMDKAGKDVNKNGKADRREGKDVAHKKPLARGFQQRWRYSTKPEAQPLGRWSLE